LEFVLRCHWSKRKHIHHTNHASGETTQATPGMIDAGRVLVDSDPVEPLKPQFDQGRQGLMSVAANFDALRNTIRRLKLAGRDDEDRCRRAASSLSSG
jgi:hypothetical protein